MTTAELIAKMAKEAKVTKAAAAQAIDSITATITNDLQKRGGMTLTGFGTFSVAKRRARNRQKSPHGGGDSRPGQKDTEVQTQKSPEGGQQV